ncbi:hypothetical protein [Clostridium perfringens]|uniref:hypothetical protein n=1 Tax=Clostridium perfringens TaxID=1502 RepID=UPI001E3608FB|nr:hypothetical protein [Clostridium perfringens]WVL78311.1 hypothetical protein LMS42_015215 [Clostridium perfringens]
MKSALEIRAMMRDNLQRELDNIEDLILKEALVGGFSITLNSISSEAKERLRVEGYSVKKVVKWDSDEYTVSWRL